MAANTLPRPLSQPRLAVLVPCRDEEGTVGQVVADFRRELPDAAIYVFENCSTDRTAERAREAGASVVSEPRAGKGFVVQAMFRKVDADVYVMVDGDATYPASAVRSLIEPVLRGEAEMVIGSRLHGASRSEFRSVNRVGNKIFRSLLNWIFGVRLSDLLSGYRAFSRRFVTSIPLWGGGFETEAEMTIRCLEAGFPIREVPVDLSDRPPGSESKIRLLRDGVLILTTILTLARDYRPLLFFGALGSTFGALSVIPGAWVVMDYLHTGKVLRIPSAILAVGLFLTGCIFLVVGILLHAISRRFRELSVRLQGITDRLPAERGADRP